MQQRLYIMAKAPILGRAKTRLATDIGIVHAKRIYRSMMAQVIRQVQDPRWETVLAVTPQSAMHAVLDWDALPQVPQVTGSLSPRLAAIFADRGPTLVIGTDCPQVTAHDIAQAFDKLRSHEAVFGPAADGGFWLMGATGPLKPEIFDDIRWSHAETLLDMRSKFKDVCLLRTLTDVDDLKALQHSRQPQRRR